MISRCPSCGVPAPEEAPQCPSCGWYFDSNKKEGKKSDPGAAEAELPDERPNIAFPPEPEEHPQEEPELRKEAVAEDENDGSSSALLLPGSTTEIIIKQRAASADHETPRELEVESDVAKTSSDVPKPAAVAVGALGLVFIVGAISLVLRSPPAPAHKKSPPAKSPLIAPAPAPAPPVVVEPPKEKEDRPTARFVEFARPQSAAVPAPVVEPKPDAPAAAPKKLVGPLWVFEGSVYDLLSTRGAYGVRLVFVDAGNNKVASVEADEGGHYRVSMPAGPEEGYSLRIVHDDYTDKHVDDLGSMHSIRKADLEQRKFLMRADARTIPWIGAAGKSVRRDIALVPNVSAE
ncbi:MAG: zinc ribbon domain-containing protein [Elusimicrobiota bacterium]